MESSIKSSFLHRVQIRKGLVFLGISLMSISGTHCQEPLSNTNRMQSLLDTITFPIRLFKQRIQGYRTIKASRTEDPAPKSYQKLAQDACKSFNLEDNKSPTIKKLHRNQFAYALAEAHSNTIYIDIENDLMKDDTIKKFTMLHEMSHIKNRDGTVSHFLLRIAYGVTLGGIMHAASYASPFSLSSHYPVIVPAFYMSAVAWSLAKGLSDAEKRADRDAFTGLGCITCNNTIKKKIATYLNDTELRLLNQKLTKNNMKRDGTVPLCIPHRYTEIYKGHNHNLLPIIYPHLSDKKHPYSSF